MTLNKIIGGRCLKKIINKKILILLFTFLLLFTLTACDEDGQLAIDSLLNEDPLIDNNMDEAEEAEKIDKEAIEVEGNIEVHFIDVGQGDSVFIRQGDFSMLIDGGENSYGDLVVDYLRGEGIEKLDYVIGTHPHSDHIGGIDDVINSFDIGKVIMPKVTHTTKTFEDVILAIKNKELKITTPNVGDKYSLGDGEFIILGPSSDDYKNLNDYSIMLKLSYGDTSFLFTGDAEKVAEEELLSLDYDISVDVLHVGHHGSKTSSRGLDKIKPKYGIIQVAEDNIYNLPNEMILDRLKDNNVEIYRNDIHGTVKVISDGTDISIYTEKQAIDIGEMDEVEDEGAGLALNKYIGNKNSKTLHKDDCSSLPDEHNRIYFDNREDAISKDYKPCSRCNP